MEAVSGAWDQAAGRAGQGDALNDTRFIGQPPVKRVGLAPEPPVYLHPCPGHRKYSAAGGHLHPQTPLVGVGLQKCGQGHMLGKIGHRHTSFPGNFPSVYAPVPGKIRLFRRGCSNNHAANPLILILD